MAEYQHILLNWVASQSGLTGAVIMAAGLASSFYGYRLLRFLLVIFCGGLAYAVGLTLEGLVSLPPVVTPALGLGGGLGGLLWPVPGMVFASGATWALCGAYLAGQLGFRGALAWAALAFCGCVGTLMALLCRRAMTILLTSVHGAVWMIVGFVGLSATIMPSVSTTFRNWASGQSLMIPILMLMLVTTAYSCQANAKQGAIFTGGETGLARDAVKPPGKPVKQTR